MAYADLTLATPPHQALQEAPGDSRTLIPKRIVGFIPPTARP